VKSLRSLLRKLEAVQRRLDGPKPTCQGPCFTWPSLIFGCSPEPPPPCPDCRAVWAGTLVKHVIVTSREEVAALRRRAEAEGIEILS
jgi:hypothetical protein